MSLPKIIELFENKVIVNPTILIVKEFKALYEEQGLTPFQYLWGKFDPESPYLNYPDFEREEMILKDLPTPHSQTVKFEIAEKKCEELYYSPLRNLLEGAKAGVEKVSNTLKFEDLTTGRDGNFTQITNAIKSLPLLIKSYTEAEIAYKKELQRNRGNVKDAVDEDFEDDY